MASQQSPILHPPTKKTDEADFTPLKRHIATAYSEDPEKYAGEIGTLHRLRQDSRGAGKDITGRDILYRYYGQLDLLEVRFPIDEKNVKILFTWYDAFSQKSISQYSIAYEKASVIFNIAATCASIAALQNRFEPAGQKIAFNYLQAAAGLFQYINENFLHAPSVDLSRDSIKSLADLMLAQAQEVFLEKVIAEKKKGALVSKLAAQASHFYAAALDGLTSETVKGQFDKAWIEIIKIKTKHFESIANLHRSYQLEDASKYGESVAYATKAEALAKEAHKMATSFNSSYSSFTTYVISPTVSTTPASSTTTGSASAAIAEQSKLNLSIVTDRKNSTTKDNDIIYHDLVPSIDSLPAVDKVAIAKPITFAEVCVNGQADVARIIGPDIFQNLIPLSVHEAASMYSEEKAKILRAEQDNCDSANEELHATIESLNLMTTLTQLKQFTKKGSSGVDDTLRLPQEIVNMVDEIRSEESQRSSATDEMLGVLEGLKKQARDQLDEIGLLLDKEQFECEQQRAKYMEQWTQEPSTKLTSQIRQDVRQNRDSYEKAAMTDQSLYGRISESKRESNILRRPLEEVESIFAELVMSAAPGAEKPPNVGNLIDDIPGSGQGALEEQVAVEKIENMLAQLRNLKSQRGNVVSELKAKIHEDDIASTLVLNKNKESQVFQSELSKFQPLRAQIAANLQGHAQILGAVTSEFERLKTTSKALRTLELRHRKRSDVIKDWKRGYESWKESKEGLRKGVRFYSDLNELVLSLKSNAVGFVNRRNDERANIIKRIEENSAFKGQQVLREQLAKLSLASSPNGPQPGQYGAPPSHLAGSPLSAPYGQTPNRPPMPSYPSVPSSGPTYLSNPSYPAPVSTSTAASLQYNSYPYATNAADPARGTSAGPGAYGASQPPPPSQPYTPPVDPYNPGYNSMQRGGPQYPAAPPPSSYAPPPAAAPSQQPYGSHMPYQHQPAYAPNPQQPAYAPKPQQPPHQPAYAPNPQQQYGQPQPPANYSQQGYGGGYSSYQQPPPSASQPNYAAAPVGAPGYAASPASQYPQQPPAPMQPMQPGRWPQGPGGSLMD
ncbi:bck1-like resistance to osmotic shock [Dinochytrium kinnereticum]|nr:bck1-like resistance to osmotic shock [Dinochytrium kinnereticum]